MTRRVLSALVVTIAIALAGCSGSATPAAPDLWKQVQSTLSSAQSGHLVGNLVSEGKSMKIDLAGNRAGTNQKATVTVDGATAEIISVDGKDYIKGDAKFWESQGVPSVTPEMLSKYIASPASMGSSFSLGTVLDEIAKAELNVVDVVNLKVDPGTLDGKSVYVISERVASKDTVKVYTSADGKAALLKLEAKDDSGVPIEIVFSEWDSVKPVTAPAPDQVIEA